MNDWKHKLGVRLPALVMLAATLLFWSFYERYEPTGPALIRQPSIADAVRMRGDCTGSNGWCRLSVIPGSKTAGVNFTIPGGIAHDLLRVHGEVKVDGVVKGRYDWSCARLLLIQYDGNNHWIPGHHALISLDGTVGWTAREDVFEIDPKADRVDLSIQQIGKEGSAEFRNLLVEPVRLRTSFKVWQGLFAVLWLGMGAVYFKRCRLHRRRQRLLILLNAAAIIFGVLMPEKWIEGTSDYMADETAKMIAKAEPKPPSTVPKSQTPETGTMEQLNRFNDLIGGVHGFGHLVLFASLCFLVYLSAALEGQHRSYYFKVAFDILLFSAITESLQYLTLDRKPGVSDWAVDACGMAVAFLLFLVVKRLLPKSLPVS